VCNFIQTAIKHGVDSLPMANDITIIRVEEDGPGGFIVTFSDRTFGAYVVEELLELRPHRETVQVESRPTARGKA
jgi:hypothetical protein